MTPSRVKAGSNTSTVALRVVGRDEKGSLESETVKYSLSPTGLGPENDCAGEAQQQLQTTDPSSCQRESPTSTNPQPSDSDKYPVVRLRWVFYSEID
jgi:hypothetical protein